MSVHRPRFTWFAAVVLSVLAGAGCTGQISDSGAPGGATTTGAKPGGGPGAISTPVTVPGVVDESFVLPVDSVSLLPFAVRVEKVASVVGVTTSDPVLKPLVDASGDLGGYDFANSRKPDYTWTALRISGWVRVVKPVCASPQMHARYTALPAALPALIEAAYGRGITAEDSAAVDAGLLGLTLDDAARYEAVCLSVLSSLEFLAQ